MITEKGFGLVELVVSLFIFSIVTLGVAKIDHEALQSVAQMARYSIALSQLNNLSERLLVNTVIPVHPSDIQDWNRDNQQFIKSRADVTYHDHLFSIILQWNDFPTAQNLQSIKLTTW